MYFFFTYSTAFFEWWQLAHITLLLFSHVFIDIFIKRDGIPCNTGTAKKYGHGYQGGRPAGSPAGSPAGRPAWPRPGEAEHQLCPHMVWGYPTNVERTNETLSPRYVLFIEFSQRYGRMLIFVNIWEDYLSPTLPWPSSCFCCCFCFINFTMHLYAGASRLPITI